MGIQKRTAPVRMGHSTRPEHCIQYGFGSDLCSCGPVRASPRHEIITAVIRHSIPVTRKYAPYPEMPSLDISAAPSRRAVPGASSTPMTAAASQAPATMGNQRPSPVG